MTEAAVSFAGNLTDPEVRYTESGIARGAMFRVAVSGRRGAGGVVLHRDCLARPSQHAAESLAKGSRVVVMGRLQQRTWTDLNSNARSTVEVVAEELGPSLRWATTTTTRATRSESQ